MWLIKELRKSEFKISYLSAPLLPLNTPTFINFIINGMSFKKKRNEIIWIFTWMKKIDRRRSCYLIRINCCKYNEIAKVAFGWELRGVKLSLHLNWSQNFSNWILNYNALLFPFTLPANENQILSWKLFKA